MLRSKLIISAAVAAAAGYMAAARRRPAAQPTPFRPLTPPRDVGLAEAESAAVLVEWVTEPPPAAAGSPAPDQEAVARFVPPFAEVFAPVAPAEPEPGVPDTEWVVADPDPVPVPARAGADLEALWVVEDADPPAPPAETEPVRPVAQEPAPVAPPLAEGRFWIGGWAAAAGHSTVAGVTFRAPLEPAPPAERVVIEVEAQENVPPHGLLLVRDPGFAPDREGFTLMLAAGGPGAFSASGRYRVLAA